MDEQLVLTAQTLKLNPLVQRAEAAGEVFVVKNVPARKYLTVTIGQWSLLRNFANPATAPDVLRAVILNRTCLPLREYYELVLKAQRAGILHVERQSDPEVRARRWAVAIGPWIPLVLTWIAAVVAVVMLVARPVVLPQPWPDGALGLVIGWAIMSVALSLGQLLAASVLRGGGGEVYEPRFLFLRPVPYFGANLEDACMTSRLTQAGVWSARLFPVMASAVALWWYRPEWGFVHVLGVLAVLRPVADGSVCHLLSTLCRGQVLDTQKNFLFSPNRRWKVRLSFGIARISAAYVLARIFYGLAWVVLVLATVLHAVGLSLVELFKNGAYWTQVGGVFGVSGLLLLAVYFGRPVVRSLIQRARHALDYIRVTLRRWRADLTAPVPPEVAARLLAESLLFRRVPPHERTALLERAHPRTFKAWKNIYTFSDKPTEVGIIISGRVAILRRLRSGRGERALVLAEGDVFGAHALLDPDRQQAQVKALSPVMALMIPIDEFQQRVVARSGVPLVNDLVQKVPFLRSLPFCANWHPQALARFAQLAAIVSYEADEVIVADRQDSQQFFVVYEGRVVVKREGRVRARLKAGAFFGEIGLLQNSAAVSDVVAREPTRCLTISKADFLRFVTHNPLVGLQLEEISSHRLGRPIFPLDGHSFDVR